MSLTDLGLGHLDRQAAELPSRDRRAWSQALSDAFVTLRRGHGNELQDLWAQACAAFRFPFIQAWPKRGRVSIGMNFQGTGKRLTAKGQQILRDLLPRYAMSKAFVHITPENVISSAVPVSKYWRVGRLLVWLALEHTERIPA